MMRFVDRVVFALCSAAVVAALGASPVFAQDPPRGKPSEQQRAQAPSPVQGELTSVDPDKKTITVKTADGDMQFAYTDNTDVSGAQKGVAGLAAAKNARVTVHFTEDAQTKAKVATRIIVEAKKG
jgi:hypothetical protein